MRRILFISPAPYWPWAGACHRLRHTLEALHACDYAVDLLTVPAGAPPATAAAALTVPRLPGGGRRPQGPSLRRCAADALLLFKAVYLAGRRPYDLIHGVDDGGVIAWLAGRLTRTPFVFERHSDLTPGRFGGAGRLWLALYDGLERRALRAADAAIGGDPSVVERLTALGRRSRACLIPDLPAVTDEPALPARNLASARFRTGGDQKLVTCVGSYTRFQGLDLFFNALPHVLAAQPATRFVVVGGDEAEIRRMRRALDAAGLPEAVAFPGRLPPAELAALLAVSDVLVSPRRAGASVPIKVLDYLHAGRPVAAADTPANRAVLNADNAVVTAPTPEGLAAGILKLCRSPALGAELGRRGRETLERQGRTPAAFRDALRRCYDYVLADAAR